MFPGRNSNLQRAASVFLLAQHANKTKLAEELFLANGDLCQPARCSGSGLKPAEISRNQLKSTEISRNQRLSQSSVETLPKAASVRPSVQRLLLPFPVNDLLLAWASMGYIAEYLLASSSKPAHLIGGWLVQSEAAVRSSVFLLSEPLARRSLSCVFLSVSLLLSS